MSVTEDWKLLVLQRYAGEYPPLGDDDCGRIIHKSSEDIAFDLSGMGDISATEVSAFLVTRGYSIVFDDGKPVWVLTDPVSQDALPE